MFTQTLLILGLSFLKNEFLIFVAAADNDVSYCDFPTGYELQNGFDLDFPSISFQLPYNSFMQTSFIQSGFKTYSDWGVYTGYGGNFSLSYDGIGPPVSGTGISAGFQGYTFTMEAKGYFYADTTGTYDFQLGTVDDYAIVSIGAGNAFKCCQQTFGNGSDFEENAYQFRTFGTEPRPDLIMSVELTAGKYYPIRVLYIQIDYLSQYSLSYKTPTSSTFTTDFTGHVFSSLNDLQYVCDSTNQSKTSSITSSDTRKPSASFSSSSKSTDRSSSTRSSSTSSSFSSQTTSSQSIILSSKSSTSSHSPLSIQNSTSATTISSTHSSISPHVQPEPSFSSTSGTKSTSSSGSSTTIVTATSTTTSAATSSSISDIVNISTSSTTTASSFISNTSSSTLKPSTSFIPSTRSTISSESTSVSGIPDITYTSFIMTSSSTSASSTNILVNISSSFCKTDTNSVCNIKSTNTANTTSILVIPDGQTAVISSTGTTKSMSSNTRKTATKITLTKTNELTTSSKADKSSGTHSLPNDNLTQIGISTNQYFGSSQLYTSKTESEYDNNSLSILSTSILNSDQATSTNSDLDQNGSSISTASKVLKTTGTYSVASTGATNIPTISSQYLVFSDVSSNNSMAGSVSQFKKRSIFLSIWCFALTIIFQI